MDNQHDVNDPQRTNKYNIRVQDHPQAPSREVQKLTLNVLADQGVLPATVLTLTLALAPTLTPPLNRYLRKDSCCGGRRWLRTRKQCRPAAPGVYDGASPGLYECTPRRAIRANGTACAREPRAGWMPGVPELCPARADGAEDGAEHWAEH